MSTEAVKKLFLFFGVVDVVVLNVLAGYFFYTSSFNKNKNQPRINPAVVSEAGVDKVIDACGDECRGYIDNAVALQMELVKLIPTPVVTTTSQIAKKVKTTSYYPIPGSGETRETAWTNLAGTEFYFDKKDFSGFKEAFFELNGKLVNGSGEASFRLFDATNGIAVNGSEVKTASPTSVALTSGGVSIWEGRNLYKVQSRSLTSEPAVFESGRIKIILEN